MKVFFDAPGFDGQLLRALNYAPYRGAELGECLAVAGRITPEDEESWFREWFAVAERLAAAGEESARRDRVGARDALLRASNYFRTAYFFLFGAPVDRRLVEAYRRQRDTFRQAAALFDRPVEPIAIPFDGTTLPGYFFSAGEGRRPTLLAFPGYDSTAEESYFGAAAAALERGFNCLVFEGPGQGGVLVERGLPLRPDWERVVTPVVDYALARPEVDQARVVLLGRSFGGYLAPRGASAEPRLAALIADPGIYDAFEIITARLPAGFREAVDSGADEALEGLAEHLMAGPLAQPIRARMWIHGLPTAVAYLRALRDYTLKAVATQIRCPTLVTDAEDEPLSPGQASRLYEALTCPKRYIRFAAAEGAGAHTEAGAATLFFQRAFDWLTEVLPTLAST